MSYSVPVKQTIFDGHAFRSRTEARFAVFFNEMNIEYKYEPHCYEFPLSSHSVLLPTHPSKTIKYIPDFFMPTLQVFIEIKPHFPNTIECMKAFLLSKETGLPVFVCWDIKKMNMVAFFPDERIELNYTIKVCTSCNDCFITNNSRGACVCGLHTIKHPTLKCAKLRAVSHHF